MVDLSRGDGKLEFLIRVLSSRGCPLLQAGRDGGCMCVKFLVSQVHVVQVEKLVDAVECVQLFSSKVVQLLLGLYTRCERRIRARGLWNKVPQKDNHSF